MSCKNDCTPPLAFPKRIANRPGLAHIDYRIGAYAELRERMVDLLNKDTALAAWTHRGNDDPGIALLEGTAIVGDILTFYQQHYANEMYLRTAQWRESVAELVRLLGYRLAPGVGGEATFALGVKGDDPVTVPKGFGLKAQLDGQDKPAEFESVEEITAYPHLSKFNLYRRLVTPYSTEGTQSFYVFSLSGIPEGLEFKNGDRVLVGAPQPSATAPTRIAHPQILIVDESWESFGHLYVKFTTGLKWSGNVFELQAYKLDETFHHFGHNAPPIYFTISGSTTIPKSTWYYRDDWEGDMGSIFYTMDFSALQVEMPLDQQVKDLAPGDYVVIQARIATAFSGWVEQPYTLVGRIASVADKTLTFATVSGPSTVLTLEQNLLTLLGDHPSYDAFRMDLRTVSFHQVQGAPFALRAEHQPTAETSGDELYYFGTDSRAQTLLNRTLLLAGPDDATQTVTVTEVQSLAPANAERDLFRRLTLDGEVTYANFDRDAPLATVYGNLVSATQGKTQAEVTLGSGDRRATFQTFALPKSPLTYLLDETHTPAQVPELHVYVDGIEWEAVDTFFNVGPDDAVYVVREDENNQSFAQFGDGKTGRRLPSRLNNVTAAYRVGQAAYVDLKAGTNPSITSKLDNFDKLYLPAPVTVGAEREDESNARVAAPGKMQSLGRMVSIADIEAEALMLPHVLKVRALWVAPEGVPLVRLTVLTQSGETADVDAVRDSMRTFNRCRGPARHPIDVVQGIRQYVYLNIEAGIEASRRDDDVIVAIKKSLGLAGEEGNGIDGADGLFGLNARQFAQGAHKSQIVAAVQNTEGVTWVKLKAAQDLALGAPPETDPTQLVKPSVDIVQTTLACPGDRLLALYRTHLTLSVSKDESNAECAT
jgi:hypothetical protein